MVTVEEIKAAIGKLPQAQRTQLASWINESVDDEWDRQIKADVTAGRLDELLKKVRSDIRDGNVREMP
jgi:hypothetical protein